MIVYVGDIHGAWKTFKSLIDRYKLGNIEEITYIIQVGDFGIGFNNKYDMQTLEDLNNFFKERNIICIAIRGNHDDPYFFQGNHIYSNLQLVPDYTTIEIDGKKHLFVGGAVSIDRKYRVSQDQKEASYGSSQRSWWHDEIFILDEEKLKDIYGVEVVVTHTAPEWCHPDNRKGFGNLVDEFVYNDKDLYADLDKERQDMSKMFQILKNNGNYIKEHYYGHYHASSISMNGYCIHYLLNINEFR